MYVALPYLFLGIAYVPHCSPRVWVTEDSLSRSPIRSELEHKESAIRNSLAVSLALHIILLRKMRIQNRLQCLGRSIHCEPLFISQLECVIIHQMIVAFSRGSSGKSKGLLIYGNKNVLLSRQRAVAIFFSIRCVCVVWWRSQCDPTASTSVVNPNPKSK